MLASRCTTCAWSRQTIPVRLSRHARQSLSRSGRRSGHARRHRGRRWGSGRRNRSVTARGMEKSHYPGLSLPDRGPRSGLRAPTDGRTEHLGRLVLVPTPGGPGGAGLRPGAPPHEPREGGTHSPRSVSDDPPPLETALPCAPGHPRSILRPTRRPSGHRGSSPGRVGIEAVALSRIHPSRSVGSEFRGKACERDRFLPDSN